MLEVRADGSVASARTEDVSDDYMRNVEVTPALSACLASVQATIKATKFRPAETKEGRPAAALVRMGVSFTIHKS